MLDVGRRQSSVFGAAAIWPIAASVQQAAVPVVGFVNAGSSDASLGAAFRKGLDKASYLEGQNVVVECHWLEGHFDHFPAVMADLMRRHIAVIATPAGNLIALTAKAPTTTTPIVFSVGKEFGQAWSSGSPSWSDLPDANAICIRWNFANAWLPERMLNVSSRQDRTAGRTSCQ
jgi:hypothetical protein